MVKLPKEDSEAIPQARPVMFTWENYLLFLHNEPVRLMELEGMAEVAADYMRMFYMNPNIPSIKQFVMDRLRQLYNLEFKIRCDECGTAHYQDEISAPER